jgi:hypothetical protein
MRTVLVLVAALALVSVGSARVDAAKLALEQSSPPALRGAGFARGEHVVVVATNPRRTIRREATVSAAGRFTVRLTRVAIRPCDRVVVNAVGTTGDRATLRLVPMCPPPDQ